MRHCPPSSFRPLIVPFCRALRIAGRPFPAHAAASLKVISGMVPAVFGDGSYIDYRKQSYAASCSNIDMFSRSSNISREPVLLPYLRFLHRVAPASLVFTCQPVVRSWPEAESRVVGAPLVPTPSSDCGAQRRARKAPLGAGTEAARNQRSDRLRARAWQVRQGSTPCP